MKKLIFILILFCLSQLAIAQTFDPVLSARLQASPDSLKAVYNMKGISACVFYTGQGTWKGISGISHGSIPIHSEMQFGIGSNTKLFTAVALLKLAEDNLINLDDSLHEWLPSFANIDSNISIRQLLNHTSGLADYNDVFGYPDSILINPNRVFTTTELVNWVGAPLFASGTGWSYSNTNYLLAGMIAESASGHSISQIIRQKILIPLQLDSTFFDVQETVQGDIAHPWQMGIDIHAVPRTSLNSAAYSAGAMYSTSGEMVQWYRNLLGSMVLDSNSFNQMTTFVGTGNYGLGISKIISGGRTCFAHGGSIRGYFSFMLYDTSSKIIISVLINSNPAPAKLLAESLLFDLVSNPLSVSGSFNNNGIVSVYPNPTKTTLFIETENNTIHQCLITNSIGQVLQTEKLNGNSIDVSGLPKGIYFIQLKDKKGQVFTSKFIKE